MEPRIQYAKTKDGVSIAFWTLGEGMPLVDMPDLFSHIQLEWQFPEIRRWYEQLAEKRRLVRYDGRGRGLSDRDVADYSLDALVMDLEAVLDRLALERCVLFGVTHSGPVAIAYAAQHPNRVSHLILWQSWARTRDTASPQTRSLARLIDTDWQTYTETMAHIACGWSEGERAQQWAALARASATPEATKEALRAFRDVDLTYLLPEVKSPTLVLHHREATMLDVKVARGLASRIPDARLALLEGSSQWMTRRDLEAIDDFLGEGEETPVRAELPERMAFRTVLFTDVEGSTALTQRLGDAKAREVLREHERIVREALKSYGGSEVKTLGDGFMTSFSSATRALESAIAMQRAFAQHNQSAPEPILVRVGLNAGEPIAEEDDLYGTAVNLAARIAAKAKGGEILASDVVRGLVAGKDFPFADRGRRKLRGFEEPVRLFEVRWQS